MLTGTQLDMTNINGMDQVGGATDGRPNIIFIMADDHASKSISCYGAGINHTPNLDRLATEGMLFNHCYVTNSICTPSRAAILTGTHNHVNGVMTLDSKINKHIPNVAKHLRTGGYQTAMVGKWHLGEGEAHEPTGFDYWSVLPGQGDYFDPEFIGPNGVEVEPGYATDIITDKSIAWMQQRDPQRPFFLMCHHKAPHRSWECDDKHKHLYKDPVRLPDTFTDDYKNRARAAEVAQMRVADDLTYHDLGLVQPDGGNSVGTKLIPRAWFRERKIPAPEDVSKLKLIDKDDGTVFTFQTKAELAEFKFQRYMQRYLRTIQSIDDNVGRMLDWLDQQPGLAENTMVIYTSDQGFFLGEHGWFDKRFMYEESFQMPLLVRYPREIKAGSVCNDIVSNVDFAATWLDLAGMRQPTYMQGVSFRSLLKGTTPENWQQVAYHRYWMHRDIIHEAYAHYGVRDQRYKLIYWYNQDFGLEGTRPGGQPVEWELFDCDEDPLELFNCYHEPKYADVVKRMTRLLEDKMAEIGDEPAHKPITWATKPSS
jgi:arylsulfatase A-like enzyme